MEEIWKDIKGFEGCYQISNYGRVKSLCRRRRKNDKILKALLSSRDYLQINLHKNGEMFKYLIHRLVAEAFIPNPNNYPVVNHKDENKQNNCITNLEWCNTEYNNNYGTRIDKVSQNNSFAKIILQYSKENNFIKEWGNTRIAIIGNNFFGKDFNKFYTIKRAIQNCCIGERESAYGFKWKYK